jgi:hypothetical protein
MRKKVAMIIDKLAGGKSISKMQSPSTVDEFSYEKSAR